MATDFSRITDIHRYIPTYTDIYRYQAGEANAVNNQTHYGNGFLADYRYILTYTDIYRYTPIYTDTRQARQAVSTIRRIMATDFARTYLPKKKNPLISRGRTCAVVKNVVKRVVNRVVKRDERVV
jgi:hypothetical protein